MAEFQKPWRIGVDVGGTFTDLVLVDVNGKLGEFKSLTTPKNPSMGVKHVVQQAAQAFGMSTEVLLLGCSHFIHGTTIATNMLLELKGAKTLLLTTEGFRDTLEIRRGLRSHPWDHRTPWPEVLVRRKYRLPIRERINKEGQVVTPINVDSVRAALSSMGEEGIEAVAICFLNSYKNPSHEEICRDIVNQVWPHIPVSCSSVLVPRLGEYERCSTAVINAYLTPTVGPYLEQLQETLTAMGLGSEVLVVQSNGGSAMTRQVRSRPATLALSGPAAGVGSLNRYAETEIGNNLICIEIGGTSCDVTLVNEGRVAELDLLDIGGRHIALPSVEIHTIGTGGGTIAGVDQGGILFVGPHGAGADPGPACYGLGGSEPTITDAQLILGRLRSGSYANGTIYLDTSLAEKAIAEKVAVPSGLTVIEAAAGIIDLAEQQIQHAIERVSYERGIDARRFTLVGAGGAGALHLTAVARAIGASKAFVPKLAGVFCAFGLCNSDVRLDLIKSINAQLDQHSESSLLAAFKQQSSIASKRLTEEGFDTKRQRLETFVDLKYLGQSSTLSIPVDTRHLDYRELARQFEVQFDALYGHHQPDGIIELQNLRLAAYGVLDPVELATVAPRRGAPKPVEMRKVYSSHTRKFVKTAVYNGRDLHPGNRLPGPAMVEEVSTTVMAGPLDTITIDNYGNYLISTGLEGAQ